MSAVLPMTTKPLIEGVWLEQSDRHVRLRFDEPRQVLSSAVYNGGFYQAEQLVNLKVNKTAVGELEAPAQTLQRYCQQQGWQGTAVGMMTAASMNSLRVEHENLAGEELAVVVTTGLDNARRAGDLAEYRQLADTPVEVGTINTVLLTSARVAPQAMVELVTIATEAKAAILQELSVTSPLSGALATGTGTDAIAVVAGHGASQVEFAGKHTLLGERVARLTMAAIRASVSWYQACAVEEFACAAD